MPTSLRARREALVARADLRGDAFCAALAGEADRRLAELLDAACGGDTSGVALIAVGGYGRGELCPFSDLDVVLVHVGRRDVGAVADAVWYPVWDEGVRLDHSVRRPQEVLDVAAQDLRAQLGLIDGRLVAGDAEVAEPLLAAADDLWRRSAPRALGVLAAQAEARRHEFGDVAFLLEPELKESHGGLRDVVVVDAIARALPTVAERIDVDSLRPARSVLTAARVELQRSTGRATDRLLLQEQDQVASRLGYTDADELMAAISAAGRSVAWVVDGVWRRRAEWGEPTRRGLRRGRPAPETVPVTRTVEAGVALRLDPARPERAEVVLGQGSAPDSDPALALRVAAVAAERSLPVERSTLHELADRVPPPPTPWTDDVRQSLVRVLAAGRPAVTALEAIDHVGLLARVLPEWAKVRNRPQRNAYHRFTVDRHLLEAAAEAAPLAMRVDRPDLLLIAALLHDIGKGYPGDHTDVGVGLVTDIAARMGFDTDDVDVLVTLVRHHLLLADLATRRDIDDPATVDAVVDALGDRRRLALLAALTEADSLATGSAAWGPWKAGLVARLVRNVDATMSGEVPRSPPPPLVTDRHRRLMSQVARLGRSVVVADGETVTVVADDRPGLLAAAAGVLALHGLDVRSADVAGEDRFAVEIFTVEASRGRRPDGDLLADELDAALRGTFPLAERLDRQAQVYRRGRRPLAAHAVATRVSIDNAASAASTVVEVRTADALGLLHRVTSALFDCDLDVVAARVSTLGHEVVDAFYVRDHTRGGKIDDAERLRAIGERVERAATTGEATAGC